MTRPRHCEDCRIASKFRNSASGFRVQGLGCVRIYIYIYHKHMCVYIYIYIYISIILCYITVYYTIVYHIISCYAILCYTMQQYTIVQCSMLCYAIASSVIMYIIHYIIVQHSASLIWQCSRRNSSLGSAKVRACDGRAQYSVGTLGFLRKEPMPCRRIIIYIYIYVYIYIYIYVCMYIYIYIYVCVCIYIYIYIYISLARRARSSVYWNGTPRFICVYIYIYRSIYISIYLSLSHSLSLYTYIYIYICLFQYLTTIIRFKCPTKVVSNFWLRTNGVDTNGAAAKAIHFDRSGEKGTPQHFLGR